MTGIGELPMTPRTWRKKNDLTLRALARKMKIAASYVSEVERGRALPSGKILKAYYKLSTGQVTPADFKKGKKA